MGHDGVASGYSEPTGFRRLTGFQRDPRDRGVIRRLLEIKIFGIRRCS